MTAEDFAERFGNLSTAAVIRETPQGNNRNAASAPTRTGCLVPLLIGLTGVVFSIAAIVLF